MSKRPPLRLAGGDVVPVRRLSSGRAIVVYLDRDGHPTPHTAGAWPHELRGIGWHLAEIKKLIAGLPLEGAPIPAPPLPQPHRGWLFVDHAIKED
jgi:hypothetical protein